MRLDRLPLTYDECRARFDQSAASAGARLQRLPIDARGPHDQRLSINVAVLGAAEPRRALLVLSGVHGVEGFIGSHGQCELLDRLDPSALPADMAVVLVHAVNPWGMAHGRRQNESNVDLNRNWRRNTFEPVHNEAYDEIHALAAPSGPSVPDPAALVTQVAPLLAERGEAWVRDAITRGQYRHADGLHFGGDRTEESCLVLERVLPTLLGTVERLLVVDLHTGHGASGEIVLLSAQPPDSPQDRFLREVFGATDSRIEATVDNPGSSTGPKTGQIANGIGAFLGADTAYAVTLEVGTADDMTQLAATYQELWVHNHGDRADPDHREVARRYRDCFTPDDPHWERRAADAIRTHLDVAVDAVVDWPDSPWR